ncbi:MAG: TetR/AcrR family transcriptional regulator [Solirubrobacterales bacterium]
MAQPLPEAPPEDVRTRLVNAAITLLAEDGPWAINARGVAGEIGMSTMAVYTHFGGMPGLFGAVVDEGFGRLAARFNEAPVSDDPAADMAWLALTYRESAHQNPHLFDLMYGFSTPGGYRPGQRERGASEGFEAAYDRLVTTAARMIESGRIHEANPDVIAAELWSFVHGFVTLELGGYFARFASPFEEVFLPLGADLMVGMGDTRQKALDSNVAAGRLFGVI